MTSATQPLEQSLTDQERRRRRRALIRAHHPDRGGDPAELDRLLRQLDEGRLASESPPEVTFVRRRRWWRSAGSRLPLLRHRRPRRVV